jgi:hypothetical protein
MLSSASFLLDAGDPGDPGSMVKGFPVFPLMVCAVVLIRASRARSEPDCSCQEEVPALAVAFDRRWSGAKR